MDTVKVLTAVLLTPPGSTRRSGPTNPGASSFKASGAFPPAQRPQVKGDPSKETLSRRLDMSPLFGRDSETLE